MTAWSHLPNANHIDQLLAKLNTNPTNWCDVQICADVRDHVWAAAYYLDRRSIIDKAWCSLNSEVTESNSAWGAIAALIVWDDCAYLLDNDPEHVKVLALLGVDAAVLLYPACIALQKEMELL